MIYVVTNYQPKLVDNDIKMYITKGYRIMSLICCFSVLHTIIQHP